MTWPDGHYRLSFLACCNKSHAFLCPPKMRLPRFSTQNRRQITPQCCAAHKSLSFRLAKNLLHNDPHPELIPETLIGLKLKAKALPRQQFSTCCQDILSHNAYPTGRRLCLCGATRNHNPKTQYYQVSRLQGKKALLSTLCYESGLDSPLQLFLSQADISQIPITLQNPKGPKINTS